MNINELTVGDIKTIQSLFQGSTPSSHSWEIGKNYLIRTVTFIVTGKLVSVDQHELALTNAAWIADTGRYSNSLVSCDFSEVEPYPQDQIVLVGRGSLIDATQIKDLPKVQK